MIVDYIDSHRESVRRRAGLCGPGRGRDPIAPSTYYARSKTPLTDAELDDAYLANQLRSLWQDNWGVYGARKLWHAARRAGHDIGRDQVARLMKIAGIAGTIRGKHRTVTTRRDDDSAAASGSGQAWLGMPRPASTSCGWPTSPMCGRWPGSVYVAFVVDVFSRRILGWRVTTTKHTGMVTDALRQALQVRRRGEHDWVAAGLIHHSDAGSQYVSVAFTAELIAAGIAGSIGTVGDALDNALCESTIGLFKTEAINLTGPAWTDRRDVEWQVARWVHWYNTDRLHSSIGHLPPIEFEHHHRQARTATPDREVA